MLCRGETQPPLYATVGYDTQGWRHGEAAKRPFFSGFEGSAHDLDGNAEIDRRIIPSVIHLSLLTALHRRHSIWRFSGTVFPPFDHGTMWSRGLSYENKSQVGKIALAISAFRSKVPDLCLSPIRSEGRWASLHSIIRLAGVPPCGRALMH